MNRARATVAIFGLAFVASAVLFSCKGGGGKSDGTGETRQDDRLMEAPPEPSRASYGLILGDAPLLLVASARPERPFPKVAIAGPAALDLSYGEDEAGYSFRVYGSDGKASESDSARFDLAAEKEARRGSTVYRIEGRSLLVFVEGTDTQIAPPRRWDSARPIVAGPVVFQDLILVATDTPAFVALDRTSLAPVFERPMGALAYGPLIVLTEPRLLVAFHGDGTIGLYSLDAGAGAVQATGTVEIARDPVAVLIDPSPEALAAMEVKTATLAGRDSVRFPPVQPHGPRNKVSEEGPLLFRTDADDKGGPMRLYVDGALTRPYLVAAFNAAGEFIKSNIDYMGAERVLELRFEPSATYFFAVAFLSDSGLEPGEDTATDSPQKKPEFRFMIVPKK